MRLSRRWRRGALSDALLQCAAGCTAQVLQSVFVRRDSFSTGSAAHVWLETGLWWSRYVLSAANCSSARALWERAGAGGHRRGEKITQDPSRCRWNSFERRAPCKSLTSAGIIDIQKNNFCARFASHARNSELSSTALRLEPELQVREATARVAPCRSSTSSPKFAVEDQ